MRRLRFVLVCLLLGSSLAGQAQQEPGSITLKKHNLQGTHTLLVPVGWTVEGGVWHPPSEAFNWLPSRNIWVTAPDGSQIHFRPDFRGFDHRPAAMAPPPPGSLNAQKGLLHMPMPLNPDDWARWMENESRRLDHRVASINARPAEVQFELTTQLRALHAPMVAFMRQNTPAGGQMQSDQLALTVASTLQLDGKSWDQIDAFNNTYAAGQLSSVFGGVDHFNFWGIENTVSMRAPAGKLSEKMPLMLAVVNSLRLTPEWQRQLIDLKTRLSGINHQMAMQSVQTYAKIAEQTYRAGQAVNDSIMSGYEQQSQASDRGQQSFVNYVREMTDYNDGGSVVTLPQGYDNVFSNGRGEYVLSNDASFQPGADWSRLNTHR